MRQIRELVILFDEEKRSDKNVDEKDIVEHLKDAPEVMDVEKRTYRVEE